MKASLRRWRGFSLHKHGGDIKDRRDLRPLAQLDELAQASQDMQDMRDCYDSLLSAAAATASSAYEFSESMQEMGACLLEITALNDNEESGKVLLMLGKIQFELQKLVDSYRSHIFQTITIPSESLLNELQTVEEMKQQCEEKRNVYDYMVMRQREKGRSKSGKGEMLSMRQLQEAHDEYDQEATLFVFRMKSLKKGQSRSLLTQAARHYAAQLSFFKKAVKSLEALEPHVKMVTEKQHIDYQFRGLEDDDIEDGDTDDNGSDSHGDGELSFDYGQNDQEQDSVSPSRKSVEKDLDRTSRKSLSLNRDIRKSSQSAPFFSENKSDLADRRKQMPPSSAQKFSTYVLPTPGDTKSPHSTGSGSPVPRTLKTSLSGRPYNLWHSSPLDPTKFDKSLGDEKQMLPSSAWKLNTYVLPTPGDPKSRHSTGSGSPVPRTLKTSLSGQAFYLWHSSPLDPTKFDKSLADEKISRATAPSVLIKSNNNTAVSSQLPTLLGDGFSFSWLEARGASDSKKVKRQAFSGPILRNPMPQPPSSPKVSPSASPTFKSSPEISELHELPRPPARLTLNSSRPMGMVGHSAPLLPKGEVLSAPSQSVKSNVASPLPKPPQAVTRSFSIPSSSHKLEAAQNLEMPSPPLSPITLSNNNQSSAGSEPIVQAVEIRGNSEQSDLVSLISNSFSKQNMTRVDIHVGNGFVG